MQKGIVSEKNFINLTPDTIEIADRHGRTVLRIPPSGEIAYPVVCHEEEDRLKIGETSVPVYRTRVLDIASLPPPREGIFYIVGAKVKSYLPNREDVLAVDSARKAYRKEEGTLVAQSFRYVCQPAF